MFEKVYYSSIVKKDEEMDKIYNIIETLYNYYRKNIDKIPEEYQRMINKWGVDEIVKDQIAGMTDRYAINVFTDIFVPKGWQ